MLDTVLCYTFKYAPDLLSCVRICGLICKTVYFSFWLNFSLYYCWSELRVVCIFSFSIGTIVSVGDPKKKYTKFEKIGQG